MQRAEAAVRTTAQWIGATARPLLSWLTVPDDGPGSSGVVIAAPLGYGYAVSHRTLRTLAERLARRGHSVLRVDYDGTGDSAGDQWDPGQLGRWAASLSIAADELRALGSQTLQVVALQSGVTLTLLEADRLAAARMVLWDPVIDGRRLVKEIRLLGAEVPDSEPLDRHGAVVGSGTVFSVATLAELRTFAPASVATRPARHVLVLDRVEPTKGGSDLTERLRALGADVDHDTVDGIDVTLDRPAEYATVPEAAVRRIVRWIGQAPDEQVGREPPPPRPVTSLSFQGVKVREEVVTLGPAGLVGILTQPVGKDALATVVWLSAGSEPHVGPGRAWVEYARALAIERYASVRLDFSGWGESPDLGRAPGRPYDVHGVDEAVATVAALQELGHRHVVLAGLCAGAWVALRAALSAPLSGVVAINPQLYWQPGDPVEADIVNETRLRRQDEIDRFAWGADIGMWTALERLGLRHPASDWLDRLGRTGIPTLALFAEGDDGLQFVEDRVGDAWGRALRSGTVEVAELDGLDHPMHRHWQRPAVVRTIIGFLDRRVGPSVDLRERAKADTSSASPEHPARA